MTSKTDSTTETITAKVTDYTMEWPVRPPDFWSVEIDGRKLSVMSEWDPEAGSFTITSAWWTDEPRGQYSVPDADLTDEQEAAVHASIKAEIDGLNLELLDDIVRAIIRDTNQFRKVGVGGILDNYREIPQDERVKRDLSRPAPAISDEELKTVGERALIVRQLAGMSWDELKAFREELTQEIGETDK
jgi:hypothetical protein